jgi:hypothetical protein
MSCWPCSDNRRKTLPDLVQGRLLSDRECRAEAFTVLGHGIDRGLVGGDSCLHASSSSRVWSLTTLMAVKRTDSQGLVKVPTTAFLIE